MQPALSYIIIRNQELHLKMQNKVYFVPLLEGCVKIVLIMNGFQVRQSHLKYRFKKLKEHKTIAFH